MTTPDFIATDTAVNRNKVDKAIMYALAQLGKPYQWGGNGPNSYDCSGLTQQAYKAAGVNIPRTALMQMHTGKSIANIASALPGDLLFPYANGSHVAMYLGNNQLVEAPTAGKNVQVTKVYSLAGGIKRIVDGGGTAIDISGTNTPPGNGAEAGAATTLGNLLNILKALSSPADWASLGFIGLGITFVGISFIPMLKEKFLP